MTIGRYLHGWCKRCGMHKYLKARRLCESCYMAVRATGHLDSYPTKSDRRRDRSNLMCHCYSPIPQRLGVWDVEQCLKCGKKLVTT